MDCPVFWYVISYVLRQPFSSAVIGAGVHAVWVGRGAADGQLLNRHVRGLGYGLDCARQHSVAFDRLPLCFFRLTLPPPLFTAFGLGLLLLPIRLGLGLGLGDFLRCRIIRR